MKIHVERKKQTEAIVTVVANAEELASIKNKVLRKLAPQVKVAGFREGKVPIEVVEKSLDQNTLQSEFLNEAINSLYISVLKSERLRPVDQPEVSVTKFVPFQELEVTLNISVVGDIKLPNYKKVSVKKAEANVKDSDVKEVLENLKKRAAEKKSVERAAKDGDETIIDFSGVNTKGEAIEGATGKDYPLVLGSKTFIPGFEDNVIGMKPGDTKDFKVTFPKDYGSEKLQNAKVTFTVTLKSVNELVEPKLDDAFAGKVGPFETLADLKADIKKQLQAEADARAERDFEAAIVNHITDKTSVEIPESLIDEQQEYVLQEVRQNAIQRGLTYEDFLKSTNKTEETFLKEEVRPEAERRVKAGLVLTEIADLEGIDVSDEELDTRIEELKKRYRDPKMHDELKKPENQREIAGRLRTEKVIEFLKTQ